jgi:hypothetical protein
MATTLMFVAGYTLAMVFCFMVAVSAATFCEPTALSIAQLPLYGSCCDLVATATESL